MPSRATYTRWSPQREMQLRKLWLRGDAVDAIAEELGCSYQAMIRRCANIGLPPRLRMRRIDVGTLQRRFEERTIPEPNSGCLLWIGATDSHGYGHMRVGRRLLCVTHIALALAGWSQSPPQLWTVPRGFDVCHSCDNPACVNVNHLFGGSHSTNIFDSVKKGRWAVTQLTHCPQGHPYTGANLHVNSRGARVCVTCNRRSQRAYRARKRFT
jgi:hypothetical protein